ncbi:unnamed protein product [Heterobilharzia americana]|nr:unnamed protein product [Heterobilharzia americana]
MTSRLDRLFVLLENCPNASLRAAAAEQLGEVAKNAPSNIDYVFTRLVPLLRHKNWVSRVAASDAIRAIVHHLPEWDPILARSNDKDDQAISTDGFLSLNELRLDRVLAQGARLYSMDARELDKTNKRSYIERCKKNDENTVECDSWEHQTETYSPKPYHQCNAKKLIVVWVWRAIWITPDDLADEAQPGFVQLDVETCVRSTYVSAATASDPQRKRSSPCQSPPHCDAKRTKLESQTEIPSEVSQIDIQSTASGGCSGYFAHWPLDKLCTTLLGDLWALRWETRHGAAAGLRELLSEPRHTRQAGKYIGQTQRQMQSSHRQYLEDIVVRVLCTLALDQLSDFISDEVVAPVRETAAQLLGVLSLHLTAEQVLLVTKHLIYLVSLNDDTVAQLCNNIPCQKENTNTSKNSWMIAHGGLLGIKYLLASRKDLKDVLLPHVAPCLISRLFGIPISTDHETSSQHNLSSSASVVVDDEDIRAAAGSALLPIIDTVWIESLSQYEYNLFVNHVWSLIRKTPSDLSPSTGPVLSLICALTKAECEGKHLMRRYDSTFKSNEDVSIYQIDTSTKIVIIAKLLHHVSSSIRQSALNTLQCVIESCEHQAASLSVDTLYIILDNLFQRILLEPCATIRALVTNLIIEIINSAQMDCLVQASIRRLDVWLCQVMQPTGIPYPNKFLVPCLQQFDSSVQVSSELNTSNNGLNNQEVLSSANTNGNSNEQRNVFISNQTYCIGGFQCLTASRSEMEAYVLETRISAVRVLANLCGRVCQYNQLIPVHLLPCISEITESSSTQPFSSVNNDSSSISVMNYILGQLLCQLHLKDRLAMQRFISGLLLSAWALLSPFSSSPSDTTYSVDSSMTVANDHISLVDRCEQLPNFHMLTYTWANLLNESSKLPSSSTSSSVFLPSYLDALKTSLSGHLFTNIQTDLQDITKRLRGRLESCLTEVIYYEEILAPFKLMQEDCRELIRSMKTCGLTVDSQIPVNGVLTIAHCKALLQTVASTIQKQKHQFQTIANCGHDLDIDSFKLDRLCCQFERTRTTVDHCLTLQLYLGNRVELGIACAFANLNWILPGRLSLLIRPLMDTIRCMKPCVNLSFSTVQSSNSSSSYACSNSSVPTSASVTAGSPNTMLSSITNSGGGSNSGNASVDILPIGTCIYLQRLAACCLARLLWLEWKMLLDAKLTSPSSLSTASKDLHVNTSKAAAKVIKNLTAYLIDSDPDLLLSSTQTSDSSTSEINRYLHEDQLLDDAKMSCGDQTISVRLDTESTSSSPSSYESQCQSSQYRGAYNTLSCICHAFITFYHCEEVSKACQFSSSLSSQTEISKSDSFANYPLTHASLNSVRFGLPSLWSVFWVNPVEIIISAYRQLDSFIENGKSNRNDQTELDENNYSLLKKLSHETKLNNSSLNAINVPKSKQDELVTGLTLLVEKKDDVHVFYEISFEQIIWLGSLVVRLPYPACRRIGARLLAELTLLQPVHTLNILLPLLLLSNDSSFLISDSSAICIGALETFLTIVDKFTNTNNKSTYMLRNIPPAILNDPLVEPNSKSSCLLSVYKKSIGASRCSDEQLMMKNNTEVKLSENLSDITVASSTIDNNHSAVATELSLSSNLKLFLPYLVLLLTPTLRLISSANEETRSVAGKLFTALLNLLPLETSLPNPEKMKEEFKQIRVEHREFIDSLLHPDRIQLYNLPIKIKQHYVLISRMVLIGCASLIVMV